MSEYTVILSYDWSIHGNDIKKMFHNNGLKWNSDKVRKLTNEELGNEYKKYNVDRDFIIDKTMFGSSGIYENNNKSIMIKVIKIENVDNMLIIYKGIEEYIDLIKHCRNIGSLVLKIVNDEVIFKGRLNVKLLDVLNNVQGEKEIKIRNFIGKIKILEGFKELYSIDFKEQWIDCIRKS